jgi:hypothetical protein
MVTISIRCNDVFKIILKKFGFKLIKIQNFLIFLICPFLISQNFKKI